MTNETDPPPDPAADPAADSATDPGAMARDWITIVQSELASLAADREMQEALQRLIAGWASAARALIPHDGSTRPARTAAAARPASAAAAPDARDAEIERLGARIAELESRLAALERGR
jgi:hypothetical protein